MRQPRVLVVSPSHLASQLGRTVLWRSGIERSFASDEAAAFDVARSWAPNLVVLDSGESAGSARLARRLRDDPATRQTAIAAVSREPFLADADALRQAGVNVVIPPDPDPLMWDARLEELLSVPHRREAQIPVRVETWSSGSDNGDVIESRAVNISVNGVLLEPSRALEVGLKVDLRFRLPGLDEELRAMGEVVRRDGRSRSGIKFIVLRGQAREAIAAFVEGVETGVSSWPARSRTTSDDEWEAALRASEALRSAIFESSPDSIIVMTDAGRIVDANPATERMLGYSRGQITGTSITDAIAPPSGDPQREALASGLSTGATELVGRRIETTVIRADGAEMPIEITLAVTPVSGRKFFTAFLKDVSALIDRKEAEARVHSLAYYDALTGLPNRRLLLDRVQLALAQAARDQNHLAVLYIGLDRFEVINDSLGHDAGDQLIKDVVARILRHVRQGDTLARVEGDEFTVVVRGLRNPADAGKVAQTFQHSLDEPLLLGEREVFVTASIGISVSPADGDDAQTLLKNAHTALFRAKEQGPDSFSLYDPSMNAAAVENLRLEHDLRRALSRNELVMHYQPVVDLVTGEIHGIEALIRWRHPERGLIHPKDFIHLAETTGVIRSIGPWCLKVACAQARAWQLQGAPRLGVAVNLSARQLQHMNLVAEVTAALEESGLAPAFLELEITETSAMQNPEATIRSLAALKSVGVRISIDDFGTGYSSLSQLQRLPIDTLKIDQSFVRDITTDPNDAAIATAIITLGHTLKLSVVAEGVETAEQLAFLMERGCDRMQGYLLARPMPPGECAALLAAHDAAQWQPRG